MPTQPPATALEAADDLALADRLRDARAGVLTELRKVIVGQDDVVEQALTALFAGGHCLIVGVPGLAKTLLVHTLAQVLDLNFARVQFTPDLMPSDITGTDIIQEDADTGRRRMAFVRGPVFTNILLADEVNRTPPKTQAALLEAMQEKRVTVQGRTYVLEPPFFVFATQNPIELEGTYPLPEAQLDRFMFQVVIRYLSEDDELSVVQQTTAVQEHDLKRAMSAAEIVAFQRLVRRVPVAEAVARYAVHLVRATRPDSPLAPDAVKQWVTYGASVRAAQYLVLGGKARALMHGRYHVSFDDIAALAAPILRHRILLNFHAQAEKVTTDTVVEKLLAAVARPRANLA
ncbi:MAG: MoxR family ATPase [Gemmatimonadetes bacterium]|nr:MoxR family ATPase [Gemmatimonadota bacterium]